jgi:hypothetical protein
MMKSRLNWDLLDFWYGLTMVWSSSRPTTTTRWFGWRLSAGTNRGGAVGTDCGKEVEVSDCLAIENTYLFDCISLGVIVSEIVSSDPLLRK